MEACLIYQLALVLWEWTEACLKQIKSNSSAFAVHSQDLRCFSAIIGLYFNCLHGGFNVCFQPHTVDAKVCDAFILIMEIWRQITVCSEADICSHSAGQILRIWGLFFFPFLFFFTVPGAWHASLQILSVPHSLPQYVCGCRVKSAHKNSLCRPGWDIQKDESGAKSVVSVFFFFFTHPTSHVFMQNGLVES